MLNNIELKMNEIKDTCKKHELNMNTMGSCLHCPSSENMYNIMLNVVTDYKLSFLKKVYP